MRPGGAVLAAFIAAAVGAREPTSRMCDGGCIQAAADGLSAALRAWKVAVDKANACSSDVAAAKAAKIVHMAVAIVRDGGLCRALVAVLLDLLRHAMPFPSTAAGYVRRRDGENTTISFTYRGSAYEIAIFDDGWSHLMRLRHLLSTHTTIKNIFIFFLASLVLNSISITILN